MPADRPSPRLLVVDDDAFLLRALSRLQSAKGYRMVTAAGGAEGIAVLARDRDFDLVLFDMDMPPPAGVEFLRLAREGAPELRDRFVVMSGNVETHEVRRLAAEGACRVLAKPFKPDALAALLTPR